MIDNSHETIQKADWFKMWFEAMDAYLPYEISVMNADVSDLAAYDEDPISLPHPSCPPDILETYQGLTLVGLREGWLH